MDAVVEKCVLLKNLPPDLAESDVREMLDKAAGSPRSSEKYEKIHKHEERKKDVRWIVLFKTKADARNFLSVGDFEGRSTKGRYVVKPDYCSGCIVPEDWLEEDNLQDRNEAEGDRLDDSDLEQTSIRSDESFSSFLVVQKKKPYNASQSANKNDGSRAKGPSESPADQTEQSIETDCHKPTSTVPYKKLNYPSNESVSSNELFGSGLCTQKNSQTAPNTSLSSSLLSSSEMIGDDIVIIKTKDKGETSYTEQSLSSTKEENKTNDKKLHHVIDSPGRHLLNSSSPMEDRNDIQCFDSDRHTLKHVSFESEIMDKKTHAGQVNPESTFKDTDEQRKENSSTPNTQMPTGNISDAYQQVFYVPEPRQFYNPSYANYYYPGNPANHAFRPVMHPQMTTPYPGFPGMNPLYGMYVMPWQNFAMLQTSVQEHSTSSGQMPAVVFVPMYMPHPEMPSTVSATRATRQQYDEVQSPPQSQETKIADSCCQSLKPRGQTPNAESHFKDKCTGHIPAKYFSEEEENAGFKRGGVPQKYVAVNTPRENVDRENERKKEEEEKNTEVDEKLFSSAVDSEDVEKVLARAFKGDKVSYQGHDLEVLEYIPPEFDPLKVLIQNIADTTTDECIVNFVEGRCDSSPKLVIRGEIPVTAMLCFQSPPDVKKLQDMCASRRCEGHYWTVTLVERSRSVKVTGLRSSSKDLVSLYFENKRRSGGGDVENVEFREDYEDCIVTFRLAADAERVCERSSHTIDSQEIDVRLHYSCLELDEDFIFSIPPPLAFDEIDEHIGKFCSNSRMYKERTENAVASHYGRIIWDEDCSFKVECIVDSKDRKGFEKLKNWSEKCKLVVEDILDELIVEKSDSIAVEVWPEFKIRLKEISVPDPQAVAVILVDFFVVVVGNKGHVPSVFGQVIGVIDDIREKVKRENQVITKKTRVQKYEMALLRASRADQTLSKPLDEFKMEDNGEIICKGKQKAVEGCLRNLREILKAFVSKQVQGFTKEAKDLLLQKAARDYIKAKLNKKRLLGVWDVAGGSHLVMYSKNEKDLEEAINILRSSVKMETVLLDATDANVLLSDDGRKLLQNLQSTHEGMVIFHLQATDVRFACTDNISDEIKSEINSFLDLNTTISEFLDVGIGTYTFIVQYEHKRLKSIEELFSRLSVKIETSEGTRKKGFKVYGKKAGCKLAIRHLRDVVVSVAQKDYKVSWSGFDRYIRSPEGVDEIKSVELTEKCIVMVSFEGYKLRREADRTPAVQDLKFWERKTEEPVPNTIFHIFGDSKYVLDRAVTKIEAIRREKKISLASLIREHFNENHLKDLRQIGLVYKTKVVMESPATVKLMGYGNGADTAYAKAQDYIDMLRKHILDIDVSSVRLPKTWKGMKSTDRTQVVTLKKTDQEYITVSQKFAAETNAQFTIKQIERIQNTTLYTQYIGKKRQMEIINAGGRRVDRQLWHGTKTRQSVDNIIQKGFDRNYNTGSSYGVGVYFGVQTSTSLGYSQVNANGERYMFLADVLTGEYCAARGAIRVPPRRSGTLTYDSTTDVVNNPGLFVIYHDAQAYPTYLITFK